MLNYKIHIGLVSGKRQKKKNLLAYVELVYDNQTTSVHLKHDDTHFKKKISGAEEVIKFIMNR